MSERDVVRLTVGQAVVRYLAVQSTCQDGVTRRLIPAMFGIFGHGNVCGVGQALEQEPELMPFLQPKNEQAMVHTAIGFARANRRLATLACSASIGPGSTNMVTGAAAATVNRVPVLLLPSDTFATRLQGPPMQALDDASRGDQSVNDCFRPVSVFFDRISRPEQLLSALPAAIAALIDPERAGAVTLSLHQDVQGESYEFPAGMFEPRTWLVARRPPAEEEMAALVDSMRASERPLIIAGGGVRYSGAGEALRKLAEAHDIPVAETSAGKGVLPASEMSVGAIGHSGTRAANHLAGEADFILSIGTRLIDLTTGSNTLFARPEVRFGAINLDQFDAHKLGATPVRADARLALESLHRLLGEYRSAPSWPEETAERRRRWQEDLAADRDEHEGEAMSQHQVLHALNGAAASDDVLVVASGTPHVDIHKAWDTSQGAEVQMEVGFSTMGHEIPAALGARMAKGADGEVYVLIGDGTYLMGHTELVTAVQEGLKITVVLVDNHGFQSIHALQRGRIARSFGLEFRRRSDDGALDGEFVPVDYVANAQSYGCAAFEVRTPAEVVAALEAARAEERPSVIVCHTEPYRLILDSECWWDVGVPEVSSRPESEQQAAETIAGRKRMRWFG
ncbi:MAG: 3D-(3,5/4)-trihydroxycyclohexane-1,2-dione acylhydrolase (decyclizing) [Actinobacteria bacterium]|nr:3D-(3,5/4)-trihydroxycyclohexane-1,2-dione acylhydrolase (decyclizing) [Actinomycetota bacterium]